MRINQWIMVLSTNLLLAHTTAFASNIKPEQMEQVQLPHCLASQLTTAYPVLAENKEFKIIDIPSKDIDNLALLADKVACGRFVNLSYQMVQGQDALYVRKLTAANLLLNPIEETIPHQAPFPIEHSADVLKAIQEIKQDNILASIKQLSDFYNRSAFEQTGVDAANSIRDSFVNILERSSHTDVSFRFVKTGGPYMQRSFVALIGKGIQAPAVVIGAHMDTLSGGMPGADDDASGSATVMEIARILLESNLSLRHPVYLVWYAAEERGLVGSQRVVEDFLRRGIPVKGVIQFDMTGFRRNPADPTMWVFTDYTHPALTDFIAKLIQVYIGVPVGRTQCGYGCSDHASWTARRIPAAFPGSTSFEDHNEVIHTVGDTIERLNTEHLVNFVKLGLAFAIELAS